MAKKKMTEDAIIEQKLQANLKTFVEYRKLFVEVTNTGRVYLTIHVTDATNEQLWDRVLRLFHLMDVELSVCYTHSVDGDGLEATAEGMSQYQIAILQKFVECNGVIC